MVVETPHVTVAWDGLEEVKQLSSSLGQILSSSCIPAVSTVGKGSVNLTRGWSTVHCHCTALCWGFFGAFLQPEDLSTDGVVAVVAVVGGQPVNLPSKV